MLQTIIYMIAGFAIIHMIIAYVSLQVIRYIKKQIIDNDKRRIIGEMIIKLEFVTIGWCIVIVLALK